MNSQSWMYGTMIAAGIGIPLMAAMNAGLGLRIGAPASTMLLLLLAAGVAGIVTLLTGGVSLRAIQAAPPWLYLGGLAVVFYILSITWLGPKIGIGTAILCVLFGQLLSSALIDQFGLFGAPKVPMDIRKLAGLILMAGGILLYRKPV